MGTTYYVICQKHKTYVDLDKFYTGAYVDIKHPQHFFRMMKDARDDDGRWKNWEVIQAFKVVAFIRAYGMDGVEFVNEHSFMPDENWTEVLEDPMRKRHDGEVLDLRATAAPTRVIVRTEHGDLFVDVLPDGVNTFAFPGGTREDHLYKPGKATF